ncbi:TPA: hypothetical protein R8H18_000872 [Citrobacter freundii]|nr:hypothetical protein [Citrobacter freundii]HEE0076408.1 hypothetical protein [Citrobacter freundii]HEE9997549.1 hypothetical protein [Citrobacter freundii]HEF0016609.1 hypothetical protein [Citrobacter freundii]HEF0042255.1 hypothetical protein [Citrobacter freundii]
MSSKYEDLIKNARINADCGERMSPEEVTTLLNVVETTFAALAAENAGMKAEVPMGAIVNGRAFADRLEAYPFECQGGNLNMCSDWQELIRCFEHLSEWAMRGQPETPATDAFLAEVRAQGVEMFASHLRTNDSGASVCKMIALGADEFAAQLRKGSAL